MDLNTKLLTGAGGLSIFSTTTAKLHSNLVDLVYKAKYPVTKPIVPVSIIIPAYNEEEFIEQNLRSILTQNIILQYKDFFECIVVDNESTDKTAEIASQFCQVISAPRGKLNARQAGIDKAVGEIIVACDADCYYPPNYLNLMLRHFYEEGVVAVQGVSLDEGNPLQKVMSVWVSTLSHNLGKRLHGASSAFLKSSYLKTGGFDLSINQKSAEEMVTEEEVVLFLRLKELGTIYFDLQACCFHLGKGMHGSIAKDMLLTDKRALEIRRGERF